MTLDTLLTKARLQEWHALARVRQAIVSHATDPDFLYALAALDSRLDTLHTWLSRENPELVGRLAELLAVEREPAPEGEVPDVPPGARVH